MEKSCQGCISENVGCRMLILGRNLAGGIGVQHHGVILNSPLTLL